MWLALITVGQEFWKLLGPIAQHFKYLERFRQGGKGLGPEVLWVKESKEKGCAVSVLWGMGWGKEVG